MTSSALRNASYIHRVPHFGVSGGFVVFVRMRTLLFFYRWSQITFPQARRSESTQIGDRLFTLGSGRLLEVVRCRIGTGDYAPKSPWNAEEGNLRSVGGTPVAILSAISSKKVNRRCGRGKDPESLDGRRHRYPRSPREAKLLLLGYRNGGSCCSRGSPGNQARGGVHRQACGQASCVETRGSATGRAATVGCTQRHTGCPRTGRNAPSLHAQQRTDLLVQSRFHHHASVATHREGEPLGRFMLWGRQVVPLPARAVLPTGSISPHRFSDLQAIAIQRCL